MTIIGAGSTRSTWAPAATFVRAARSSNAASTAPGVTACTSPPFQNRRADLGDALVLARAHDADTSDVRLKPRVRTPREMGETVARAAACVDAQRELLTENGVVGAERRVERELERRRVGREHVGAREERGRVRVIARVVRRRALRVEVARRCVAVRGRAPCEEHRERYDERGDSSATTHDGPRIARSLRALVFLPPRRAPDSASRCVESRVPIESRRLRTLRMRRACRSVGRALRRVCRRRARKG